MALMAVSLAASAGAWAGATTAVARRAAAANARVKNETRAARILLIMDSMGIPYVLG
jgi:hypothetical protein